MALLNTVINPINNPSETQYFEKLKLENLETAITFGSKSTFLFLSGREKKKEIKNTFKAKREKLT